MPLSDWKYPTPVPYIENYPGPEILRGGLSYGYRYENNSYIRWMTKTVKTFNLSDYAVEPSAGMSQETDWITMLELPNGYKIKSKFQQQANPQYTFWYTRLYKEDGSIMPAGYTTAFANYNNSVSMGGAREITLNHCVKMTVITKYPTDPATGMEPSGFGVYAFFGRMFDAPNAKALNLPENGDVAECTSLLSLDELHSIHHMPIFATGDIDAANNYLKTHGNPTDKNFIGETALPSDSDPSTTGGGDGNYTDNSDPVDFPDLPTGGALACGAIHAFHVSTQTITDVFAKLWSTSLFDMATWQKLVSSPLDCIISLHCLPVQPVVGNTRNIWFGNFNTGEAAKVVTDQYVTVDCGYLDVIKFFGSAMDYSPYTKMSIYLPFSGIHDLATEDVQGQRIHVKYNIDVLTGDCAINVKCGQSVLYKFIGNMKMQIPVTARDDNALGNTIKGTVGMLAGAMIGGAVGSGPGAIAGAGISAAASVAAHKVTVSRSGELTGNVGLLDEFTPYLIIHRPQQSLAVDYNKFKGYPANLTMLLSSCMGYTEVEHIHLTGIGGATDTELSEIESLLKEGVII